MNKIIHDPLGLGNPYVQGPEERIPRFPSFREPVSLGIVTEPADRNGKLSASIAINDGKEEIREARWLEDKDGKSLWKVDMPESSPYDRISYYFFDDSGQKTGHFSYVLDGFAPVDRVLSIKSGNKSFQMELSAGGRSFYRTIDLSRKNRIAFRIKAKDDESMTKEIPLGKEIKGVLLDVDDKTGAVTLRRDGQVLYKETGPLEFRLNGAGDPVGVCATMAAEKEEKFFGFGERFNSFNQRGNVLDVRVYEEYKSQNEGNRTYLPVPFFLSSRKWGHCINSSRKVSYDLRAGDSWSYTAELESFDLETIFYYGTPVEIIREQAGLSGLPVVPPDWAFGPWMSSNEWNSQERVLKELHKSRELDIPATVLVIEAWSDEKNFYIWNDALYDVKDPAESYCYDDFTFPETGLWPDPQGMVDDIHSDGTKLILWQIPVSKKLEEGVTDRQNELDKQYMIDKGYCVLGGDGSPYEVKPWWFTDSLVIDFTSPEARKWWMEKRRYLVEEMGVDGFKTDGGEHLWGRELRFSDGRTGSELWNEYPNHYIKSYFDYVNSRNGGITFSRSGFMGVQNSPLHWAGDQDSTWDAHRSIVKAVLNSGLSGIPFMGWDIGGFSGEIPSAELYLRSTAFACFGSVMQYHSEFFNHRTPHVDRTPWNIAERTGSPEVVDVYRYYAKLRMALLPYIKEEARHCGESGEPLMRFLFLDYPDDPRCWDVEDQYLFGRDMIVCPVLNEGQREREVYLPEGVWYDFFTGKLVMGGRSFTAEVPLDRIPVFRKKNPLLENIQFPEGKRL